VAHRQTGLSAMMYQAIVFLPALGALIAGFFGRALWRAPLRAHYHHAVGRGGGPVLGGVLAVGIEAQVTRVPVMRWVTSGELEVLGRCASIR
jgi:NADH-quinone oxidoreductase subunit L